MATSNFDSSESEEEDLTQMLQRMDSGRRQNHQPPQPQGTSNALFKSGPDIFECQYGLTRKQFWTVYSIIQRKIIRHHTSCPQIRRISARERQIIFLRYLRSGRSSTMLAQEFAVPRIMIEIVTNEISSSINREIVNTSIPTLTNNILYDMASKFSMQLAIPNCVGILHISQIRMMNLMKLDCLLILDAEGRIVFVDVGTYNLTTRFDLGLRRSKLWTILQDMRSQPGARICEDLPLVFVGEGFTSSMTNFLWKYPEGAEIGDNLAVKIFNCRLEPILDVARESISQLQTHWGIFRSGFPVDLAQATGLVKAACSIHNLFFIPPMPAPVYERGRPDFYIYPSDLNSLRTHYAAMFTTNQKFFNYFVSDEGIESWQWDPVIRKYLLNCGIARN